MLVAWGGQVSTLNISYTQLAANVFFSLWPWICSASHQMPRGHCKRGLANGKWVWGAAVGSCGKHRNNMPGIEHISLYMMKRHNRNWKGSRLITTTAMEADEGPHLHALEYAIERSLPWFINFILGGHRHSYLLIPAFGPSRCCESSFACGIFRGMQCGQASWKHIVSRRVFV